MGAGLAVDVWSSLSLSNQLTFQGMNSFSRV